MASGIGQTLVHEVLGLLKGTPVTAQTAYVLKLGSTAPDETGAMTVLTGNGYSDVTIDATPDFWEIPNPDLRIAQNKQVIFFPAATASWDSIQGWQLCRPATGAIPGASASAVDFFGHVVSGRIIDLGDRFKINPGGLKIRLAPNHHAISTQLANSILGLLLGQNISAPSSVVMKFGTKDPAMNMGDIGELVTAGYAPVTINASEWTEPALRTIKNSVELDHTRFWTTGVNISEIKSAESALPNGTPWFKFGFTKSKNMRIGDNLRAPIDSIMIRG